jgi:5-methylcytosine-specific restriction protein A
MNLRRSGFLTRTPMTRKRMRRTVSRPGSGIPAEVREAVILRDEGKCQRCGMWVANVPSSIQHRLPRRMGGRSGLALVQSYDMANLVLVCGSATTPGSCHQWMENERTQAHDDGWLLHEGEDPAAIPVLTEWGWRLLGDTWRDA